VRNRVRRGGEGQLNFSTGNALRIEMTAQCATVEPLNADWAASYVGGKGLLFRYMSKYVPPRVGP
jgi:aldehyde:ferredoxin oxidoreductase